MKLISIQSIFPHVSRSNTAVHPTTSALQLWPYLQQ